MYCAVLCSAPPRLEQALQEFMKDFADRMKEINASLAADSSSAAGNDSSSGTSLADKEALCDELMEIVENVDYARGKAQEVTAADSLQLTRLQQQLQPAVAWPSACRAAFSSCCTPSYSRALLDRCGSMWLNLCGVVRAVGTTRP